MIKEVKVTGGGYVFPDFVGSRVARFNKAEISGDFFILMAEIIGPLLFKVIGR